jgi:hypothetical protein
MEKKFRVTLEFVFDVPAMTSMDAKSIALDLLGESADDDTLSDSAYVSIEEL